MTPELVESICRAIRRGSYIEIAVEANGISRSTFFVWCKRARSNDPNDALYKAFFDAVNRAQCEAELRDTDLLDDMVHGRPASIDEDTGEAIPEIKPHTGLLTWRLERRYPSRWGRSDRVAVDLDAKVDVTTKVEAMTSEERRARIAELQSKLALPPKGESE